MNRASRVLSTHEERICGRDTYQGMDIQRTVHIMWATRSVHTVRRTNRTDLKYHGPVTARRLEDQLRTTIIATLSVGNKIVTCPMLHMTRREFSNWLETCGLHFPKWTVGEHSLRDLIGWIIVLGIAPNNAFAVVIMSVIYLMCKSMATFTLPSFSSSRSLLKSKRPADSSKSTPMANCSTTLPASWYTSKAVYSLERRAVFLKVGLGVQLTSPIRFSHRLVMDAAWCSHPMAGGRKRLLL